MVEAFKASMIHRICGYKVCHLTELFRVARPTSYRTLALAIKQEFVPRRSVNDRFRSFRDGLKRLAKVEHGLAKKCKHEARRYNKSYPGELVHFDNKHLPLIKGEDQTLPRTYLFVAIEKTTRTFPWRQTVNNALISNR